MINQKRKILKELYPEDLYEYSNKLTIGEIEVLKYPREIIESELNPIINDHWSNATFPFKEFYKLAVQSYLYL